MHWLTRQVEARCKSKSKNERMKIIKANRRNFKLIIKTVDIPVEDWDKPMTLDCYDSVLGLENPYSKATCLILYLYSMELGNPQLYADANRVSRDFDLDYLWEFGPFLKALGHITDGSEFYKKKNEKITTGFDMTKFGG